MKSVDVKSKERQFLLLCNGAVPVLFNGAVPVLSISAVRCNRRLIGSTIWKRASSRRLSATDQGSRPTAQFAAVLSDNRNAVADSVVCHAEALTKSTDEVSWIALCRVR